MHKRSTPTHNKDRRGLVQRLGAHREPPHAMRESAGRAPTDRCGTGDHIHWLFSITHAGRIAGNARSTVFADAQAVLAAPGVVQTGRELATFGVHIEPLINVRRTFSWRCYPLNDFESVVG